MEYLIVGIGGLFGSITRFSIGRLLAGKSGCVYYPATFMVNITGSLLLGLVSGVGIQGDTQRFLGDGFFGAYTTFSTFMYEGFRLFKDKNILNALVYIMGSIITGVTGFALGVGMGMWFK